MLSFLSHQSIILFSEGPFPDLNPDIDLTLGLGSGRRRRSSFRRKSDSDSVASDPNSNSRRLQPSDLGLHLRVQLHLQRQAVSAPHARLQIARLGAFELLPVAPDPRLQQGSVLLPVDERRNDAVADVDVAGEDRDRDRIVDVDELLVRVPSGDGEVESGVELGGGGEVEVGELEGGDGEGRALRAVDDIEGHAGEANEEDEDEEGDGQPEAAGAAPAAAVPRLGAVRRPRVAVELRLRCREGRIAGAVDGGLGGGVDSVGHRGCRSSGSGGVWKEGKFGNCKLRERKMRKVTYSCGKKKKNYIRGKTEGRKSLFWDPKERERERERGRSVTLRGSKRRKVGWQYKMRERQQHCNQTLPHFMPNFYFQRVFYKFCHFFSKFF